MKFKVFVFLVLFSSVTAFSQNRDEQQLKNLILQMVDAQTQFEPNKLDALLTSDYIEISPVGEFDTREKVLGFYQPELKPPADKMSVKTEADDFSIRSYGKFAVVIARLNYLMTGSGKTLPPRSI